MVKIGRYTWREAINHLKLLEKNPNHREFPSRLASQVLYRPQSRVWAWHSPQYRPQVLPKLFSRLASQVLNRPQPREHLPLLLDAPLTSQEMVPEVEMVLKVGQGQVVLRLILPGQVKTLGLRLVSV